MPEYAFAASDSLSCEEKRCGDVTWVVLRSRGAEKSYLTPAECVDLAREWIRRYDGVAPQPT